MDNMDLTNLNSTVSDDEVKLLLRELHSLEADENIKLQALKKAQSEHFRLNAQYEDLCKIQKANDLAYTEMEAAVMLEVNKEADDLKSEIALFEDKASQMKDTWSNKIDELKKTISELESLRSPTPEDSTLDAELVEMMEQNAILKENLGTVTEEIEEKNCLMLERQKTLISLEAEFTELKQQLSNQQQILKENKLLLQVRVDEKTRLNSLLGQQKHLSVGNKQCSIFDEVIDETSKLATDYELLKKKFIKAKETLSCNNAEINKLKVESSEQMKVLDELKNSFSTSEKEIRMAKNKRIDDLKNNISMAERMIERTKQTQLFKTTTDISLSDVLQYHQELQGEIDSAKRELDKIIQYHICHDKELSKHQLDLTQTKKDLKSQLELNSNLEQQIKQYKEGGKQVLHTPSENLKKVTFKDEN